MGIRRVMIDEGYENDRLREHVSSTILGVDWKFIKKVLLWGVLILGPLGLLYWLLKNKFRGWLGAVAGLPLGIGAAIKGYGESALDVMKYSLQAGRLIKPEEVALIKESIKQDEISFKQEAQQQEKIKDMYKAGGAVTEKPDLQKAWAKDLTLLPATTATTQEGKILVSVPFNGDVYTTTLSKQGCNDIWGTTTDNKKIGGSLMSMIYNRYMHIFPTLPPPEIAKRIKAWEFMFTPGTGDYWAPRVANYWEAFKANTPQTDKQFDMFEIEE